MRNRIFKTLALAAVCLLPFVGQVSAQEQKDIIVRLPGAREIVGYQGNQIAQQLKDSMTDWMSEGMYVGVTTDFSFDKEHSNPPKLIVFFEYVRRDSLKGSQIRYRCFVAEFEPYAFYNNLLIKQISGDKICSESYTKQSMERIIQKFLLNLALNRK